MLQRICARERKLRVAALDVVAVEGVSGQAVRACHERQCRLKRDALLAFEYVAVPDTDERAVAEQAQVACATARAVRCVRLGVLHCDLNFDVARRNRRARVARISERDLDDGLAAILVGEVLRGLGTFTGDEV